MPHALTDLAQGGNLLQISDLAHLLKVEVATRRQVQHRVGLLDYRRLKVFDLSVLRLEALGVAAGTAAGESIRTVPVSAA